MAIGILGQAAPTANTNTTVYTVPASLSATFNINVVNIGGSSATVTVAISAAGTPTTSEYVEWQVPLPPGGVLERGGFVAQTGKRVVVNCSTDSCSVSVYGFEQ